MCAIIIFVPKNAQCAWNILRRWEKRLTRFPNALLFIHGTSSALETEHDASLHDLFVRMRIPSVYISRPCSQERRAIITNIVSSYEESPSGRQLFRLTERYNIDYSLRSRRTKTYSRRERGSDYGSDRQFLPNISQEVPPSHIRSLFLPLSSHVITVKCSNGHSSPGNI